MILTEIFEVHDSLNPNLWTKDNKLRDEVKLKLLEIVQQFIDSCEIPLNVADVHLVGSNASYNYTKNSDLDVHIVSNFDLIDVPKDILQTFYNALKTKFNSEYNISIHSVPVEIYVEDINSTTMSNGIYSMIEDKWIKFPEKIIKIPQFDLTSRIKELTDESEFAIQSNKSYNIENVINKLYLIRKNSIDQDGEYGEGNQLFKEIRSNGTLDKLKSAYKSVRSKELTLETCLREDSRMNLLSKSKRSQKGFERFKRRVKSRVANTVKQYNAIDMNKLFKQDILTVDIQVRGETDTYTVKISFGGFLELLHDQIKSTNQLSLKEITRALVNGFNRNDVYIHCSCLHPDTLIKLLNGDTLRVEDMCSRFNSGEKLWVYSVDENGDFVPGEVEKVWETKHTTRFIRVTLDNDEQILTTPEHLFMLRDGTYIPAAELVVGQSLMPLYFSSSNGYETVKLNSSGVYHSTYKLVADVLKKQDIEEAKKRVSTYDNMKYDIAIHHKDFNKLNNNPDNLQIMTAREHWDYHSKLISERFKKDPIFRQKVQETARKNIEKINANPTELMKKTRTQNLAKGQLLNNDPTRKAQQSEFMKAFQQELWKNISMEERANFGRLIKDGMASPEVRKKLSESLKAVWKNYTTDEYEARCKINAETNQKIRSKLSKAQKCYWESLTPEEYTERCKKHHHPGVNKGIKRTEECKQKHREQRANETLEQKNKRYLAFRDTLIRKTLNKMLSDGVDITFENYEKYRVRGSASLKKCFTSIEETLVYFGLTDQYNHKVKMVEVVDLPNTPVYDIKVKGKHQNFLLAAGVIVHNCPDSQYRYSFWQTKNKVNSGDPENRPANITNPHDSLGSSCKHVLLVLSNTSWLLKVGSVIYNYINYMEKHYKKLYADIIYPAIYMKKYEEPVQLDIFDDNELSTDSDTIDTSNQYARTKNQFKPGNDYRFKPGIDRDQVSIDAQPDAMDAQGDSDFTG